MYGKALEELASDEDSQGDGEYSDDMSAKQVEQKAEFGAYNDNQSMNGGPHGFNDPRSRTKRRSKND